MTRQAIIMYAGFLKGSILPGMIRDKAVSVWASLKSHPQQKASDLQDIGYSVKKIIVSWVE